MSKNETPWREAVDEYERMYFYLWTERTKSLTAFGADACKFVAGNEDYSFYKIDPNGIEYITPRSNDDALFRVIQEYWMLPGSNEWTVFHDRKEFLAKCFEKMKELVDELEVRIFHETQLRDNIKYQLNVILLGEREEAEEEVEK
jgi:RNAse (barnase) inhibitor barstar